MLAEYKGKQLAATGQIAQIKVVGHGPVFEVYLNGEKIIETVDDTFAKGYIGLRTYGDTTIPSDAMFAKLTIKTW